MCRQKHWRRKGRLCRGSLRESELELVDTAPDFEFFFLCFLCKLLGCIYPECMRYYPSKFLHSIVCACIFRLQSAGASPLLPLFCCIELLAHGSCPLCDGLRKARELGYLYTVGLICMSLLDVIKEGYLFLLSTDCSLYVIIFDAFSLAL